MKNRYTKIITSFVLAFLVLCGTALAANRVVLSPEYFPNPLRSGSISGGSIYVGIVDLDPKIVGNQKQISVLQENGATIPVAQPIKTNAGGTPQYNGSPVTIFVDGAYSLRVDDKYGSQVYYVPTADPGAEFADIAAETVNNFNFDNIAALRAFQNDGPVTYETATVSGYYAPSDGGGGPLRIWVEGAAPGTYVDNGGSRIVPGDGSAAWLFKDPVYNPDFFGAKGDGSFDDKDAIFETYTAAGIGGFIEFSADKIYAHSAQIFPLNRQTFDFNNSTLFSLSTMSLSVSDIWIQDVDGVTVKNLVIDGNRAARTGTNGGAGIWIGDADDIILRDIEIADPNNDGITIGYDDISDGATRSFRPVFDNIKVFRAYRNGLSVVGVVDASFTNIICNNTVGTNPEAGIDVEADSAATASENVRFTNITVNGNAAFGFGTLTADDRDIFVSNIEASNNGTVGVLASNNTTKCFNISGSGNGTSLTSVFALDLADIIDDHRIIQSVRATSAGPTVIAPAGGGYVDTTFTASITTKWPSSAIIAVVTCQTRLFTSSGTILDGSLRMVYDAGTQVGFAKFITKEMGGNGANSMDSFLPVTLNFYDVVGARGTTRFYKLQARLNVGDSLTVEGMEAMFYEIAAF